MRKLSLSAPPSVGDVYYLLIEARPTLLQITVDPKGCEQRRVEAINKLRRVAHDEVVKAHGDLQQVARALPDLFQFLSLEGLRILIAEDSAKELKRLVGRRRLDGAYEPARTRGRPPTDERRNILIVAEVAEKVAGGMKVEAASKAVANELSKTIGIDAGMVRKLYYKYHDTDEVKLIKQTVEALNPRPRPKRRV